MEIGVQVEVVGEWGVTANECGFFSVFGVSKMF